MAKRSGRPLKVLGELEGVREEFGGDAEGRKLELLRALEKAELANAKQVTRLHEVLCFLRAYPDGPKLLRVVERMLRGFGGRSDLQAVRDDLPSSGIAGTDIFYSFYWTTARWLAATFPGSLTIEWEDFLEDDVERLESMIGQLLPYAETLAADEAELGAEDWLELMRRPDETDADCLIKRFGAFGKTDLERETRYESLEVPLRLAPGDATPSRTRAFMPGTGPTRWQTEPRPRIRPDLREVCRKNPVSDTLLEGARARQLAGFAREALITRSRDIDAIAHADPRDARIIDWGDFQVGVVGMVPERRSLLRCQCGFLVLRNGVPIGYGSICGLFGTAEVAFNVFESFRGGDTAMVFARVVATCHHVLGSDTIMMDPYQLGHENEEGLASGAWWFYQKLGFVPHDPALIALADRELSKMKKKKGYRTDIKTLARLATGSMYLHLGKVRHDVLGEIDRGAVGLAVTRLLSKRFGGDRERGIRTCAREAAELLGGGPDRSWSRDERAAWDNWSPLVLTLPGTARWTDDQRRALVDVIRKKGARREAGFALAFDAHKPLRRSILELAKPAE